MLPSAVVASVLLLAVLGCGGAEDQRTDEVAISGDSLHQLRSAVNRRQWQEAWQLSNAAMTQYPGDADTLHLVATVAQRIGKQDVAADLMLEACRAESLRNLTRLKQAMDALRMVGRIYECMDLMEETLELDPMQHQLRLAFYHLCWGTENRLRAIPHGQFLVRHNKFDVRLLLSLDYTESGTDKLDSLLELARRFPSDKRPLVAEAKFHFDQGDFEQAATLLRAVRELHSDHLPAIALLCRVLVASENEDEFVALLADTPEKLKDYPGYWLAVGDWCWSQQQNRQAVRAYWEATSRDSMGRESWLKLSNSLKQIDKTIHGLDRETIQAIEDRVTLLTRFSDATTRFRYDPSQLGAIEIAESLQALGRLWEAKAWASIGMQLPGPESVAARQLRDSVKASINQHTAWQVLKNHSELQIDLTCLPLPRSNLAEPVNGDRRRLAIGRTRPVGGIALTNESVTRGMNFFGRTAQDLDRHGVSFYQTLGCGGGALDFDLDGWPDLYLAAAGGNPPLRDSQPNRLWRNQDGFFVDVTQKSGAGDTGFGQGIAVGDVNEDGFPDLLALNYGLNGLWINNGDGTFTNASDRMDQSNRELDWSSSGAVADLDRDGIADLVVLSYGNGLEPVNRICSDDGLVKACAPLNFSASADRFLCNAGTGHFVDRTQAWGLPSNLGRGLGLVVGSFDQAPGADVFIANDQSVNHFWSWSDTESALRESASLRGLASSHGASYQGSMGIATGDLDRDGDLDFYVTNFDKECNAYHDQANAGVWRDQTIMQKLYSPTLPMVGFGTEAVDLDNDGVLEIVVSNGHVDAPYPGDASAPYSQPMQIFGRNAMGDFESIGESIGGAYLAVTHVGRALVKLDVNRDGRTDLAVTHQTEPVALLINRTGGSGSWIGLQLIGRDSSRDAVGATVEVRSGDQRWIEFQTSGDGYLCSNERILRIGVGELTGDCNVTVKWPSGRQQTYADLSFNSQWLLVEGDRDAFGVLGASASVNDVAEIATHSK